MQRKFLFAFDGPDGAGKTTVKAAVVKRLQRCETLKEYQIIDTRFPGGTDLGKDLRSLLLEEREDPISKYAEFLLFAADDAQVFAEIIDIDYDTPTIILADRSHLSSLCYQGAYGVEVDHMVRTVAMHQNTKYDAFFIMNLPFDAARQRVINRGDSLDRIEKQPLELRMKIYENWQTLPGRYPLPIRVVDATSPVEETSWEIYMQIRDAILNEAVNV